MPKFIEYELEDGLTILIEALEPETTNLVNAARDEENVIVRAKKKFSDALKDVKAQAKILMHEIEELHVDEAEIKFGLTTTGELGNLAIGKVGVDVNYEVTLKWKNPKSTSLPG